MDTVERQQQFCKKWEVRRRKKWRFIILLALFWSIPLTLVTGHSLRHFELNNISTGRILISFTVFALGGLFMGLRQFKQTKKRYLILKQELEED